MTRTTSPDPVRARRARARDGRVGRRVRDRRHLDAGADRRHDAAERPGLGVPVGGEGRRGLLPYVNAKGGVNKRKIKYIYKDDALRPVQDGRQDARARPAGQGLRDLQQPRHRAEPGDARLPERDQGAAALRRERRDHVRQGLQAVPVDDRLPAELPRRGRRSTAATSPRRARRRRSASSTRTTTTARTCSPACSNGLGKKAKLIVSKQSYDVDRRRRPVADRAAEGRAGEHADAVRDAEVRDPVVSSTRTSSAGSRRST